VKAYGVLFGEILLLQLAKEHNSPTTYLIDELVRQRGHEVLWSHLYHPHLHAIECIWSQVKGSVMKRRMTFRLDDVLKITLTSFKEIDQERWLNVSRCR